MYCLECGTKNSADSKFCKECGVTVASAAPPRSHTLTEDLAPVENPVTRERLVNLIEMAFWHNDAGNYDAAILACEAALAINPSSSTAHSLLASLYEKKGNDERAIEHLEAVVNLNPESTADATKLDQLRSGIRIKAVTPPAGYRWVPPALASSMGSGMGERLARWNLDERRVGPVKLVPALFSLGAVVIVVAAGLLLLKPSPSASGQTVQVAASPQADTSIDRSAFADPAPQGRSPIAAEPFAPAKFPPPAPVDMSRGPNPFGETLKSTAGTHPVWVGTASAPRLPSPAGKSKAATGMPALPKLTLEAQPVPGTSGTLAPAPVTIANVPHHNVMVSQLPSSSGSSSPDTPAAPSSSAPSTGDSSVIHVQVHDSNGDAGSAFAAPSPPDVQVSAPSSPPRNAPSVDRASSWQQSALNEQMDGNYRAAATAYQQAIHAYKDQIAGGKNVDAAKRGLKACQTGLQICQQSVQ